MKTYIESGTFSEACYNDNSVTELQEALASRSADKTDCKTWGITPTQWRNEINLALAAKLNPEYPL